MWEKCGNANMLHDLGISILCSLIVTTNTEMFTSLVDLETLPHTLKRTIDDLDNYISRREQKLYTLSRHADRYKTEHEIAMQNIPNYLENPIKAFTLIKQLTSDLDSLKRIMKTETEIITKNHEDLKYPVLIDLEGAAVALGRLQKTYNLTIKDLSNGNLNNAAYRPPLIASDCYVLGRVMLKDKTHIVRSLSWMIEALRKYNEENNSYSFTKINIYAYISRAYNILGDKKSALRWTEKVIEIDPTNFKARKKLAYYQKLIAEEEARTKVVNEIKDLGKEPIKVADIDKESDSYEALCRGEVVVPTTKSSRYFCHYLTINHAFLKIAPIKMEVLYHNPDVILFYEVVSESEMELIKQTARPKFRRAKVHHPETGNTQFVDQRISKFAWILDKESDTIRRISRRVMHMTNLNMASAEPLQVVNYGIGGYFEPHCDFPPVESSVHQDIKYTKTGGDRIATVMFYLSDVTQGGATVFPELCLSVHPVKGAAVYWSNLNAEGGFEVATLHAGCPVLLGSKWVANKWIHRNGQTLFQVCNLSYQKLNEISVKKSIMKDKQRSDKTEKERCTDTKLK